MNEMVASLHNTLVNVGGDWLPDIAEVGLDQCMEDGILREIPIVKTLYSVCKILYNVHERKVLLASKDFDLEKEADRQYLDSCLKLDEDVYEYILTEDDDFSLYERLKECTPGSN